MKKSTSIQGRETILGYNAMEELALDLIWCWSHSADALWRELDATLWEQTYNPWVALQTVSRERLEQALKNPTFSKSVQTLVDAKRELEQSPAWFQKRHPNSPLSCVAYFSMEYMLSESLPIYSGGLGNVAGDQLKAASDLGVPVIAIGLLYQQGYFRQVFDQEGMQQASYPFNSPEQLPIIPLRKANGEWLRFQLTLPGWSLWIRVWEAKVGRTKLFLLDSNDAVNYPPLRGITSELYGGDSDMRLKQELVLGIGGWRVLDALGIQPEVCHLNEGHAAFAILERAHCAMKKTGQPFPVALNAIRAGNLFTTHTAVPAGFDRFTPALIQRYLGDYAEHHLNIPLNDLLALGRQNPHDSDELFNMAYLAIRGSGAINGVSQLHGRVSRHLFQSLFPRWPTEEVPIGSVTNGVHVPTWDSAEADTLWTEHCGKNRWLAETETLEKCIVGVSDEQLWHMRNTARKAMIDYGRERASRIWQARGFPPEEVERAKRMFDPTALTLGFARRFATYKRPNMLLHDRERLTRILTNTERPVQLLIAGKAHPADKPGQALIKEWIQFIKQPEIRNHVIFLSDYDMLMTEHLVGGVDVWINTPRRPWEACGTSGMKVLVNGGLNVSELDGWWAEAYSPEVGWAIGDGEEHGNDPAWDAHEANQLYELLENEIIPLFYKRNGNHIPTDWVSRVRQSMARLTPRFSANRAVREYTETFYLPAAKLYQARIANQASLAKQITEELHTFQQAWPTLRFGEVKVKTTGDAHLFHAQVIFNDVKPAQVRIELFAVGTSLFTQEMKRVSEKEGIFIYEASLPAKRPAGDYTVRAVPHISNVLVPLEASQILWQK